MTSDSAVRSPDDRAPQSHLGQKPGEFVGTLAMITDVTERKQVEDAFRKVKRYSSLS